MSVHDAEHRCEAQAASGEFRGKKRLEDSGHHVRRHAAAGVRGFEQDARSAGEILCQMRLGKPCAGGLEKRRAHADRAGLFPGRFDRVDDEVHHHLTQLGFVREHRREIRARSNSRFVA